MFRSLGMLGKWFQVMLGNEMFPIAPQYLLNSYPGFCECVLCGRRQNFSVDLKILKHSTDYLIADLLYKTGEPDRAAVISHIEFAWIERLCPELWYHRPPSSLGGAADRSVSQYLSEVFGIGKRVD